MALLVAGGVPHGFFLGLVEDELQQVEIATSDPFTAFHCELEFNTLHFGAIHSNALHYNTLHSDVLHQARIWRLRPGTHSQLFTVS